MSHSQEKNIFRVNLPLLILIGDPRSRGSPIRINGGKFTKTLGMRQIKNKIKNIYILLNFGIQGMSNQ